jgi:hypothetical protein
MYRTALGKMLFILRLVIIASLAGSSVASASAAMHGPAFPATTASMQDHDMAGMSVHDHASGDAVSDAGDNDKRLKQECCKDFCGSLAIMADDNAVGGRVVSSIRKFIDDRRSFGEMPPLHLPPNI